MKRKVTRPVQLKRIFYMAALLLLLSPACSPALQPFSTDGCSLFPDRSLIGKADWCRCCVAHDLAYWRGGTAEQRLKADQELQQCVAKATGDKKLAELMFLGVRTGGGPYFFTPYRWGYGWPYGRRYEPLSSAEEAEADRLRDAFLSANPNLSCPDVQH